LRNTIYDTVFLSFPRPLIPLSYLSSILLSTAFCHTAYALPSN